MIAFISVILSIGIGFGLACLIFANLLAKSNDIGNSIGSASQYSRGVVFDRRVDRMKKEERENFALSYTTNDERYIDKGPAADKKVEIQR
ncbi:MAG: hypothetical protein IKO15_05175 [Clostridiales bacterium]|jgi:hypothetical protein|nr:hypothetical protein [Clostridiales bacterium]